MWLRQLAMSLLFSTAFQALALPKYETEPQDVTYCQLAGDPTKFSGKRIRIQAIYSYMFEVSALGAPTCCTEHDIGIWVDFDSELEGESKRFFNKFPKGTGFVLAVFVGTIETGEAYGTGQRVHFFVEHIEEVKQEANPAQGRFPAWIPQDCKASSPPPRSLGKFGNRTPTRLDALVSSAYRQRITVSTPSFKATGRS
jgi:hypothetical protein